MFGRCAWPRDSSVPIGCASSRMVCSQCSSRSWCSNSSRRTPTRSEPCSRSGQRVLSYAVSYLFIAIVWLNHHHLFGYAEVATSRLLWFNFAQLFSVSLIPFATEWIAESRLANAPVALYAAVFVLVNVTYLALCWEAVDRPAHEDVSQRMRRLLRMRSFVTIGVFLAAGLIALKWPVVAMTLICLCLITYLRPDVPGRDAA